MGNLWMSINRLLKLILWIEFLRTGMYRLFLRYYGAFCLAGILLVSATLVILSGLPPRARSQFDSPLVFLVACPLLIVLSYVMGRVVGVLSVALLAACLCGTIVIQPTVVSREVSPYLEDPTKETNIGTGDLQLFVKGALSSAGLSALSYLLLVLSRLPAARLHRHGVRWPLRWAVLAVLLISGLIGLEWVRIAAGLCPHARVPWQRFLAGFMREPGGATAMSVWLWMNVAMLLAKYDERLIPYLLRRTGHPWVASEISANETYMVDELLRELGYEGTLPARDTRSRGRKKSRGR